MATKHTYFHLKLNALPFKTQENPIQNQSPSDHAFPILVIAVLTIVATAFLLFVYYIFINKCCYFNFHQLNLLTRFATWRARRDEDSFIALSPTMWNRGLDEHVIREIPTFQYRRGEAHERSVYGCVVCLNEFQDEDMLRVLPNCSHSFHLDCIDIWLQSNTNCPLCRTSISGTTRYPIDEIIAPSSSPQGSQTYADCMMGGDEDFVVIELGGQEEGVLLPHRQQETGESTETQTRFRSRSLAKTEQKPGKLKSRQRHHVSIMGDECIDVREKDDQFSIQPIRRSFSLDSAVDRQLYLSVQAVIQQNKHQRGISTNEESSNRVQASFSSFGQIMSCRNFPKTFSSCKRGSHEV
ncbi:RING-H2 finger protein ATL16-like [Mercurialis annua]|uniref:RING-H2 finger protein ATL16-like n=1 Tax=Mercurialis annua TaxID=3986 RepID=UPI00215E77D5|nr:RING-H2 finger protein ATL16-like [Mercurialis annua]